jgi:hypothetical protein
MPEAEWRTLARLTSGQQLRSLVAFRSCTRARSRRRASPDEEQPSSGRPRKKDTSLREGTRTHSLTHNDRPAAEAVVFSRGVDGATSGPIDFALLLPLEAADEWRHL